MDFKVNKKALLDGLNLVSRAISSSTPLPSLTGIYLAAEDNTLTMIASDSNISIRSVISNSEDKEVIDIKDDGKILIEAKYILEMIRKIDSEYVNIEIIDGTLIRISGGNAEFKINGMNPEDYPNISFEVMTAPFTLSSEIFNEIISQTAFACSDNETRPVLTGVNLKAGNGKLRANATDSYRLAVKTVDIGNDIEFNVTVPAKYLNSICRSISSVPEVVIAIDNQKISFSYDGFIIQTKLLDDVFPDVSRLIPASFNQKLTVKARDVSNAIDRSSFIKSDGKNTVRLSITAEQMEMTSSNQFGSSYENVPLISFSGEPFEISCNGKYLQDAIKALSCDTVTISFNGELKPMIITDGENDSIIQLISPMRTYK